MTYSQPLTDEDREQYRDLAKRIHAAYSSWRVGNKCMDYVYKTYKIEPPDGLIRLAKSMDEVAVGNTRRTPAKTKR